MVGAGEPGLRELRTRYGSSDLPGLGQLPVSIPEESDGLEVGTVLEAGSEGAWDHYLAGASTPATVIERDGRWWLDCGGADGLRDYDGGPLHRAIDLATSRDGVRFEKFGDDPVVRHRPTGLQEEGANSAAVKALLGPRGGARCHSRLPGPQTRSPTR